MPDPNTSAGVKASSLDAGDDPRARARERSAGNVAARAPVSPATTLSALTTLPAPLVLDRPGAATPGLRESPEDQFKRALAAAVSRAEGDQLAGIIKKSTDSFVAISKSATDNALALNVAATRTMTVRLGMALSGTIVLLGLAAGVFTTASFMIVLPMISGGLATLWGALAIGARNAAETKALLAFFASRSAAVETQIKSGND